MANPTGGIPLSDRMRIIDNVKFDATGFSNENSLVRALLDKPDQLTPVITHLFGAWDKRFPLTFLTEGQTGGSKPVKNVQFEWPVIGKMNRPDDVVSSPYISTDKAGLGFSLFTVTMRTNWLKIDHNIESSHGTKARVIGRPVPEGVFYKYTFQLRGNNPNAFCPYADLVAGARWAMVGGANVAQSLSMGNESNVVTPGKLRNQLSTLRKSYRIAGNISNKVVEISFNIGGKTTNMWIQWEHFQHMLAWQQSCEEHYWYAEYNRTADGQVYQRDQETGLPIYETAGILQQIPNRSTYTELTTKKLKGTIRDVMFGSSDTTNMDVVLYTGTGGAEEFDKAVREDAKGSGFTQIVGDKFITGAGRNLAFGGFFNQYQHIDGHIVTVKHLPLLDEGGRALVAEKHPVSGLPITSYDMYFIDMSMYDGQRNVTMQHEEGRQMRTGIVSGMTEIPANWGGNDSILKSSEKDEASIHFLATKAVTMKRNTHSLILTCDMV